MATATAAASRGLTTFDEARAQEVFRFQRLAYPTRRPDWIEPRWRWMFLESAARVGVEPRVWLYRRDEAVVAHQGAIPVSVQMGGRRMPTGWFVETMVLEELRGKAIGPMLIARALEDMPFNLSLGQEAYMRALQFQLGWQQVAKLPSYVYMLNPARVAAAKVGVPLLNWGAGVLLSSWQSARSKQRRISERQFDVQIIERFDQSFDELWARVANDHVCAVVRDRSYLQWKYGDQPGQDYVRVAVCSGENLEAFTSFKVLEPDHEYPYRRALVTELLAPSSDPELVWATLNVACDVCRKRGVDLVRLDLLSAKLEPLVRDFGFARRDGSRVFLVATGGLDEDARQVVASPENWLLTRGDSDIDRPW